MVARLSVGFALTSTATIQVAPAASVAALSVRLGPLAVAVAVPPQVLERLGVVAFVINAPTLLPDPSLPSG